MGHALCLPSDSTFILRQSFAEREWRRKKREALTSLADNIGPVWTLFFNRSCIAVSGQVTWDMRSFISFGTKGSGAEREPTMTPFVANCWIHWPFKQTSFANCDAKPKTGA